MRTRALFTERGVELSLPSRTQESRALGWRVAGGLAVTPQAEKLREVKLNRLVGPAESWERQVPTYGGLRYPGVLPGVELWFEERAEGVEYGFRAERGEDLRRVTLEYAGAREVRVVEEGRALEVDLGEGVLREEGLKCAQEAADGTMKAVGCRFADAHSLGQARWVYAIEVDVEDPERPVVVDPLVLWNTYLLGPGRVDIVSAIEQNDAGEVFIAGTFGGTIPSSPAPAVSHRYGGLGGTNDVLVAKFQVDGGLDWWTLLGATGEDRASNLVMGSAGELYVAGTTTSPSFKWVLPDGGQAESNSVDPLSPGDGFVARLDSSGAQLDWFQRIDRDAGEVLQDMIQLPDGRLIVAGMANVRRTLAGGASYVDEDGFIARLDPGQRKLDWSMSIPGPRDGGGDESVRSITPRSDGSLYVTGYYSDDPGAVRNALVSVVTGVTGGSPLLVSSVAIGGNGDEVGLTTTRLPTASGDKVLVWGTTSLSTNFPPSGQVIRGEGDIFVSEIGDTSGLLSVGKTTLLGGDELDILRVVEIDSSQRVYLGGFTKSKDMPSDGGFDTTLENNSQGDGFVARIRLDPEPAFEWMSYVGGNGVDEVFSLRVDSKNPDRLFIGGATNSSNLQYSDAGFDTSPNGVGVNMFLMAVDLKASPGGGTPGGGTTDGGTTGEGEEPGAKLSPLGWSCGSTGGGPVAFVLGTLVGLALLASRRRPRA